MTIEQRAIQLARRRGANPVREARRQSNLTRMRSRVDYIPQYKDTFNNRGERVRSVYTGHKAISVR